MNIITLDGKTYEIKYQQNKEVIAFDFHTGVYNFPDLVGSKLYHNSTSSDRYSLTFAIHRTQLTAFKKSLKKIVINESEAIEHPVYGKLTHLVIEHTAWGAIFGNIIGSLVCETGSTADVIVKCTFVEQTLEEEVESLDFKDENVSALDELDTETSSNFENLDISTTDKSILSSLAGDLSVIYNNIQHSEVVSAFNNLNTELIKATLDSLRVMNAFKNILALPGQVTPDFRIQLELLTSQAEAIKSSTVNSYNLALFNSNALSYNTGMTSRVAFVSESALELAAGIKSVPLT